ncbi:MAG: hypothetical protein M1379_05055 [Firmicutes bacterium]|nr:hypothetical protein [Bacillota bacterium]
MTLLVFIGFMAACSLRAAAARPVSESQVVYELAPWTGVAYGATFAAQGVKDLYLLAGTPSAVDVARTRVYYWPITREYQMDWQTERAVAPGKLQILRGGRVIKEVTRTDYILRYPNGPDTLPVELVTGRKAGRVYQSYRKAVQDYLTAVSRHTEAQKAWDDEMARILKRVNESGLPADPKTLSEPPRQPGPPRLFVTAPASGFILNLPAGDYEVHLVDDRGDDVPGTHKKLHLLAPWRTGVGYEIMPEATWTYPFKSDDVDRVIYASGARTFYVQAFQSAQYNVYDYLHLLSQQKPLQGAGTRSGTAWVHGQALKEGVFLELLQNGQVRKRIEYRPYRVIQTPGPALGYNIVEWDPKSQPGTGPTFSAFKVQAVEGDGYSMQLVNADGKVIRGSERHLQSVEPAANGVIYGLAALPMLIGLVIAFRRFSLRPRGAARP